MEFFITLFAFSLLIQLQILLNILPVFYWIFLARPALQAQKQHSNKFIVAKRWTLTSFFCVKWNPIEDKMKPYNILITFDGILYTQQVS